MAGPGRRRRETVLRLLEDFPRQYAALEAAMAAFGEDFDLAVFKSAYNTSDDMEAYNRVQAVERALGRVQNYVADLAVAGVRLGDLTPPDAEGSDVEPAFAALRGAGVVDGALAKRLLRAQKARSRIDHAYVEMPAGDVHRAAVLVHESALAFIGRYRDWIEPYL